MALYVREIKTTSESIEPGGHYWRRLILDPQGSLYLRAAKSTGRDVIGLSWDVLRRPAHRPSEKKQESPQAFQDRVLDAIRAEPEKYYQRGNVVRLDADLREADRDVWLTAIQIREARRLNAWTRNPDACMQYGRVCDYMATCCGEAEITDPTLYQVRVRRHTELDRATDEHLTQSSLRTYRACPRRFLYRYEMKVSSVRTRPESMLTGTSVHRAIEWYSKSGGDVGLALSKLDQVDAFRRAKEAAMVMGYAAYWGEPKGIQSVEEEFEIDLVNPETGAASRTFKLAGKLDATFDDAAGGQTSLLERQLMGSVKSDPETGEVLDG